jgi:hypothetical protein
LIVFLNQVSSMPSLKFTDDEVDGYVNPI